MAGYPHSRLDSDTELQELLRKRDSLLPVLKYLEANIRGEILIAESREEKRVWQDVGLWYMKHQRFHEAISLFLRLYELICEAQARRKTWLRKGMPLVWMSECHRLLGHLWSSDMYLVLTAIADAIDSRGKINPDSGVYFRALWQRGWTEEELDRFFAAVFRQYKADNPLCAFPEYFLHKIKVPFVLSYAMPSELDVFEVNRSFSLAIIQQMDQKRFRNRRIDGLDLEMLAAYLLGRIPGFEVRSNVISRGPQYDGVIRNKGAKFDFRSDLGLYLLLECKDWNKPIGVSAVSAFANKLVMQDVRCGILFSSGGITGAAEYRDARLEVLKANYRAGKIVLILDKNDFQEATRGRNLIAILQKKYEQLKFDLPTG